mmetsp:Transcript_41682/g.74885  ORF Transcript_41682/g.74885 Transcript_41682/m.74885 type:complete len:442 (-) Transcript_41682:92-1417(-)
MTEEKLVGDFDTWRKVIACLANSSPRSVAVVSVTCSALRQLCSEDSVWRRCCECWWRRHAHHQAPTSPESLPPVGWPLTSLGVSSHRVAHAALQHLGFNAVGLWACGTKHPLGELLQVDCRDGKIRGSVVSVDMAELQNSNQVMSAPLVIPWRLETEIFRVDFTEATTAQASPKRDFAVRWAAPVVCMSVRCVSEGGGSATLRADSDDHFVLTTPKPRIGLIAGRLDIYGAFSDQLRAQDLTVSNSYRRVAPSRCSSEASHQSLGLNRGELASVQQLPGVWAAPYGAHGFEFLQVSLQYEKPRVGWEDRPGMRLSGTKITGDPNVPALAISFVADIQTQVPVQELLTDNRPLVAFPQGGPIIVDLSQRSIAGIYRAKGQINRVPGVWEPEWVGAQLLVYHNRWFSVLWQDIGEQWRHIIDYSPLNIPCGWAAGSDTGEVTT